MERKPVSFRLRPSIVRAVNREADRLGQTKTEWVEAALLARLGSEYQVAADTQEDKERIAQLEKQVNTMWSIINYAAAAIEENQENIDRIDELEHRMEEIKDALVEMGIRID